ncbi:MAG: recombinase family protein [Rhodococcus sp. (in: high G+C Gram-positive bacteria)]
MPGPALEESEPSGHRSQATARGSAALRSSTHPGTARDQLDAAALFKRANKTGWRLLDCDKADSGDPTRRLLADVPIAMAADERRRISGRTREGAGSEARSTLSNRQRRCGGDREYASG